MAYPYGHPYGTSAPSQGGAPWQNPLLGGGFPGFGAPSAPPPPNEVQNFLAGAPSSFMGLQGLQPGFDPSSLSFDQLSQLLGLTSGAPDRIDQFQGQTQQQIGRLGQAGHQAIGRQAAGQYAAGANQIGAAQRQGQGQQMDAFAAMGLAPSIFQSMVPQQNMQQAAQLGALRGETFGAMPGQRQQLRDDQFDRRTGLNQAALNARNQIEQYYDSLLLQKYLAEIAAEAQMNAAGKKAKSDTTGDLLALAGTLIPLFSDARLKEDVQTLAAGSPRIVSWRWNRTAERLGLRGRGVGMIAQEVEAVSPERVVVHPSGFKMVRYG